MTPIRQRVRVLVAEDNDDHRFFIVRALSDAGGVHLEIETVVDGDEVLDYLYRRGQYADRERPHMILLDLKMPRRGGLEVLEVIKNDPELRTIPVSILTSSDRPEDVESAYGLGTNSYLLKRPDPEGLRRELATVSDYWTDSAVLPEPPA
ncbi:MAG TPA: response regulator [Nitriliruptorales bacterium]|jgi:CheY-like chemotaxis protein